MTVPAIVAPQTAADGSESVYIVAQTVRGSGSTVVLELEFARGRVVTANYTEWTKGARSFDGVALGGKVVMASSTTGRFALRFVDPGADGVRGTADDVVRTVEGEYYFNTSQPAGGAPIGEVDWSLPWVVVDDSGSNAADTSSGCGGDTSSDPAPADTSSGCGGNTSSDPSAGASSSGCGGDTSGDPSASASSSGCGDTSSSSASSSSCGGDSGSSSSGCSSEQGGSSARPKLARRSGGSSRFLPVFSVALLLRLRPRRTGNL